MLVVTQGVVPGLRFLYRILAIQGVGGSYAVESHYEGSYMRNAKYVFVENSQAKTFSKV